MGVRAAHGVQIRARVNPVTQADRHAVAALRSDYSDVTEMLHHLHALDSGTPEFRWQRDLIFQRCLPLADHIASRYRNRGEPHDDLVQAARVGLVNAVNRFDVDVGGDFLSFAVPTMMGEVRRHFRDHGWAIKVPRRVKELQPRLVRAGAQLSQQLGRAPNASEIAAHLGIDRDLAVDAMVASTNYSTASIDAGANAGDGEYRPLSETIGAPDPGLEKVLSVETVRPLMAALPDRLRTVLTLRFFEDLSQTEIAERIGCSQMHVSRLIAQALDTLRAAACEPRLAAAG
jgi:RNA polymerase sigma-B factor